MKRSEVEVGKTYTCKVSGKLVPVRIARDRGWSEVYKSGLWKDKHSGWDAMNLSTHRKIHIATAAGLRAEVSPC